MTKLLPTGTCFSDAQAIAARIFAAGFGDEVRIVHGLCEIVDQGDESGTIIAHAWVEFRGKLHQLHRLRGGIVKSSSTREQFEKYLRIIESKSYTIDEAIALGDQYPDRAGGPYEEKYLEFTKDGSKQKARAT